jgi:hypothetical protein
MRFALWALIAALIAIVAFAGLFWWVCVRMAQMYRDRLVDQLRGSGTVPAEGDEAARVLAVCLLSPTGRVLYGRVVGPGTEAGWVSFGPDAMTVLTAFANLKDELGDAAELDANTLWWLRYSPWAHFRAQ